MPATDQVEPPIHRTDKDVLLEIFSWLPHATRHRVLPLVCKAWAAVCAEPSPLWEAVDADVRQYSAAHGCTVDATLLRRWLTRHAPAIERFNLRISWVPAPNRSLNAPKESSAARFILAPLLRPPLWLQGLTPDQEHAVGAAGTQQHATAAALSRHSSGIAAVAGVADSSSGGGLAVVEAGSSDGSRPALRSLQLTVPDRSPLKEKDCEALAYAAGLTKLVLKGHSEKFGIEQGMKSLAKLTELRDLRLFLSCKFADLATGGSNSGAMSALRKLTRLEVVCPGTHFGQLPASITSLTNLRHLRLEEGFTPLWPLPAGFGRLPLTSLGIGGLHQMPANVDCTRLWKEVEKLTGLATLHVQSLDWVPVPPLGSLPGLQELSMQSCYMPGIHELHESPMPLLKHLTLVRLSNCELNRMPNWLPTAAALVSLDLQRNDLRGGLPQGAYLSHLTHLDLSENQLALDLPPTLEPATALQSLRLEGNSAALGSEIGRAMLRRALPHLDEDKISLPKEPEQPDDLAYWTEIHEYYSL